MTPEFVRLVLGGAAGVNTRFDDGVEIYVRLAVVLVPVHEVARCRVHPSTVPVGVLFRWGNLGRQHEVPAP